MKWLSIKSTQTRISLLIGALVLAAAINAVIAITNTGTAQQQLSAVQNHSTALVEHAAARASLYQQKLALRNTLVAGSDVSKDETDFLLYFNQFYDYLYSKELDTAEETDAANATSDGELPQVASVIDLGKTVEELSNAYDQLSKQSDDYFSKLYSDTPPAVEDQKADVAAMEKSLDALNAGVDQLANADLADIQQNAADIEASSQQSTRSGQWALLILAALLVWGVYMTLNISRPLDGLTSAIVSFENGTFKPEMLARYTSRADELGQLARAVSGMAQSITESNRSKAEFLKAAERFIPEQYLEFLEKDSITKVNLGDHVSAEMAVMFSDIRGFTSMSERMTAKENFDFVNEYLKLVSPIIEKHEGFIVKFLGDGMMAIFPYGVDDAVQAGIEKEQAVQKFNQEIRARGFSDITVGIGIHTGPMMVGMIGEDLRMQGDAFSDNVNLTSRIEGLNKFYGTSMIISEDTLQQLPKPVNFKMRFLGKAVVKGRIAPLGMYEVYEGLSPEVIAVKDSNKADFEQAVKLYAEGCFQEAGQLFDRVLEKDPHDKSAKFYMESCAELADRPRPAGWNGAIVMDSK